MSGFATDFRMLLPISHLFALHLYLSYSFLAPPFRVQWGLGPLTAFGSDYVTIRWSGKVRPDFSETYTFFVNAMTGARLWIDRSLVLDTWAATVRPLFSTSRFSFCPMMFDHLFQCAAVE
jgi:hypothetical protein